MKIHITETPSGASVVIEGDSGPAAVPLAAERSNGKVPINLSVSSYVIKAMKVYIATNPHLGTLSELTERLWIEEMRKGGHDVQPPIPF